MKIKKLLDVTKKILLSSTSALLITNAHSEGQNSNVNDENNPSMQSSKTNQIVKFNYPKYILHNSDSADNYEMSHRSHRSHSSHRSHYSSYTNPTKKENEKKNIIKPNAMVYEFGSRVLKNGMSGTDVVELQLILKKLDYISSEPDGNFGDKTEKAVKKYQAKNGISETGIVDVLTYYYLNKEK